VERGTSMWLRLKEVRGTHHACSCLGSSLCLLMPRLFLGEECRGGELQWAGAGECSGLAPAPSVTADSAAQAGIAPPRPRRRVEVAVFLCVGAGTLPVRAAPPGRGSGGAGVEGSWKAPGPRREVQWHQQVAADSIHGGDAGRRRAGRRGTGGSASRVDSHLTSPHRLRQAAANPPAAGGCNSRPSQKLTPAPFPRGSSFVATWRSEGSALNGLRGMLAVGASTSGGTG